VLQFLSYRDDAAIAKTHLHQDDVDVLSISNNALYRRDNIAKNCVTLFNAELYIEK
jgi:hypothetical protein